MTLFVTTLVLLILVVVFFAPEPCCGRCGRALRVRELFKDSCPHCGHR